MHDAITAAEYRKLVGAEDGPHELDAAEYRKLMGLDEPLVAPKVKKNTEPKGKRQFADWLGRVSPVPIFTEVEFHPRRKWRADYFIEHPVGIIIEYDGINNSAGHVSIPGLIRDAEKGNEAQIMGYLFVRVNPASIRDKSAYDMVRRAFAARGIEIQETPHG